MDISSVLQEGSELASGNFKTAIPKAEAEYDFNKSKAEIDNLKGIVDAYGKKAKELEVTPSEKRKMETELALRLGSLAVQDSTQAKLGYNQSVENYNESIQNINVVY